MKKRIKASEIEIGNRVEINGRNGVVQDIRTRNGKYNRTFNLGPVKVIADDYDTEVFIIDDQDDQVRATMNRLAADFAIYVDLLRTRSNQSLTKFQDKAKTSLASAITSKAEQALIDEFIYNEISELVAKLVALDSPEDARDAVLRVVNYERDSFLDHYRTPNGSNWTSNGVKNAENAARQQMLRNDGEAYKPIMAIIDDFITKEIA